jgi:ABC-type multidrug transport system, ATPase and permease components
MWKTYYKKIFEHKGAILLLIILQVISAIISAYVPLLNGQYIDLLLSNVSSEYLLIYSFIIIFIGIIGIIITYIYKILSSKNINEISFNMYMYFTNHIRKVYFLEFTKYPTTYLNQRITTDTTAVVKFIFESFFPIITNILQFIIIFMLFFQLNIKISLIILIFLPIYVFLYLALKKSLLKEAYEYKEEQNIFFNKTNEYYELNKEIRIHSSYDLSNLGLKQYFKNFHNSFMRYIKINVIFTSIDNFINLMFQSVILILGGIQVINNEISLGVYAVINVYFSMLLSSIKVFISFGQSYQDVKGSLKRLDELLDMKKEFVGDKVIKKVSNIKIENLSFSYNDNQIVLKDFNFNLNRGYITTIIGKNGFGKTTFLDLMVGLIKPKEGDIKYEQISILNIDQYYLRENQLSVILQNESVPSVTVSQFLLEGQSMSADKLIDKINQNNLSFIYISETFNIKSYLKRNIKRLSGGERQLIILLRALMKEADVYIFDEPTSQLTQDMSQKLMAYLHNYKLDKIILLISHDKHVIEQSDVIINMEKRI